jgi:hypothetical protein
MRGNEPPIPKKLDPAAKTEIILNLHKLAKKVGTLDRPLVREAIRVIQLYT